MTLQVVTCADAAPKQNYYCFSEFKASLKRFGIEPIILGWNTRWAGLGSKPKLLKRAIEDGTITADRILFCDAFDVVFAKDPREIPELLYILWNAEKNCFPDPSLASEHYATRQPFMYFNSGLSIGPTFRYLDALNEMKADEIPEDCKRKDGSWIHVNDQGLWMRQYLFGHVPMFLDDRCKYFQTMCDVHHTDEVNMNATAFHFNGGSKTAGLMIPLLAKLNL